MNKEFYDKMLEIQNKLCKQCIYNEGKKCNHIKIDTCYHAPSDTHYERCMNYKSKGDMK